jgi:hypothetical protein
MLNRIDEFALFNKTVSNINAINQEVSKEIYSSFNHILMKSMEELKVFKKIQTSNIKNENITKVRKIIKIKRNIK